MSSRVGATALAVVIAALPLVPLLAGDRFVFVAIQVLTASLFALSFNFLWHNTRLLSFGHAAYFGAGMFSAIHLMRAAEADLFSVPLPFIPLVSAIAAGILGLLAGFFATVRTGTYFAMITLAIAELIYALGSQWEAVFGGEAGLSSMRQPWLWWSFATSAQTYYVVLGWFLAGAATLYFIGRTPLGRLAIAIGDDEVRVGFLGYHVHLAKTIVFALSAFFAGLAGSLLGITSENASYGIFAGTVSASVVLQTFIGGPGTFLGPVIGAAILTLLGSMVSDITRLWLLYVGVVFVLMMLYMPHGIVAFAARTLHLLHTIPAKLLVPWFAASFIAVACGCAAVVLAIETMAAALAAQAVLQSAIDWIMPVVLALIAAFSSTMAVLQYRRIAASEGAL